MTLTRLKIDCIRYDSAAEFAKSATFKAFCVNNRIAMEETAAYTHTFNARAEGAVRIVKNTCGVCYAAQTSHVAFGHIQCCTFAASMLTGPTSKAKVRGRNWMPMGHMRSTTMKHAICTVFCETRAFVRIGHRRRRRSGRVCGKGASSRSGAEGPAK